MACKFDDQDVDMTLKSLLQDAFQSINDQTVHIEKYKEERKFYV